jgi:hypothetical protein
MTSKSDIQSIQRAIDFLELKLEQTPQCLTDTREHYIRELDKHERRKAELEVQQFYEELKEDS